MKFYRSSLWNIWFLQQYKYQLRKDHGFLKSTTIVANYIYLSKMYRLVEIKIRNTKYFIIFAGKEFSRRKYIYDSSILLIYYFKSFCITNLENTYI